MSSPPHFVYVGTLLSSPIRKVGHAKQRRLRQLRQNVAKQQRRIVRQKKIAERQPGMVNLLIELTHVNFIN